jgi:hypothetical protein
MIKKCENCVKDFKTYKSKQRFCNKKCSGEYNRLDKILKECEYSGCSGTFEIYKDSKTKKERKFCSTKCQNKWQNYSQLGKKNGNYGRKNSWGNHSLEKKKEISDKIKKSWENPERLEKHLLFLDRHRLPDGSFDFQDKFFRDRISKANIERLKREPSYGGYKNCKRGWYTSTKTNDEEYYHSSWEELKMKELDSNGDIIFWTKKHSHVIEYYDKNIKKRYLPDFLINDGKETMLEVKGYVSDVRIFKLKCESALKYFSLLDIDYDLDFMKNKNKYSTLLDWFKNKKIEYYGKKEN